MPVFDIRDVYVVTGQMGFPGFTPTQKTTRTRASMPTNSIGKLCRIYTVNVLRPIKFKLKLRGNVDTYTC